MPPLAFAIISLSLRYKSVVPLGAEAAIGFEYGSFESSGEETTGAFTRLIRYDGPQKRHEIDSPPENERKHICRVRHTGTIFLALSNDKVKAGWRNPSQIPHQKL